MIERFGRTERALHWVHATGFFAMLATGLVLYLPALSELVARRNLVKNLHLFSALAWAIAIVLVVVLQRFVMHDRLEHSLLRRGTLGRLVLACLLVSHLHAPY